MSYNIWGNSTDEMPKSHLIAFKDIDKRFQIAFEESK